jgi:hypothetical protein
MRTALRLVAVGVGLIVALGCRQEAAMTREEHMRQFADRYTAAWCSQDPARVAEFFAPDGSLAVNGGEPAVGRDAIAAVARGFMTAFPDMRVLVDGVIIRAEVIEYHWTLLGTNTGPGGTGNRVRISGHEAWRLGPDGLIAESRGYFDERDYRRQLERGVDSHAD